MKITRGEIDPVWLLILLPAFALRGILPLAAFLITRDYAVFHSPDTASFLLLARGLLFNHNFAINQIPELFRVPGYPLFLIPGIAAGHPELITILLQILVSCFSVYLIFRISRLIFNSDAIARSAAFLYAIEPLSVVYAAKLLSETLFTAIMLLFVFYFLRYLREQNLKCLIISALTLAGAIYVRPVGFFLPVMMTLVLGGWTAAVMRRNKRLLIHAIIFLLISFGLTGAWELRNKTLTGYPGFSASGESLLYFYHAAAVRAQAEGGSFFTTQKQMGWYDPEIYLQQHPEQRAWSAARRYNAMAKEALDIIVNHPREYLNVYAKGVFRTIFDPGAAEYLRLFKLYPEPAADPGQRGIRKALAGFMGNAPALFRANVPLLLLVMVYYVLVVFAMAGNRALPFMPVVIVWCLIGYFLLVSGGVSGSCRFRHPIMPLLCVMAGYGFNAVREKCRSQRK